MSAKFDTCKLPVMNAEPDADLDTLIRIAIADASQVAEKIVLLWYRDVVLVIEPTTKPDEARVQYTVQSEWRAAAQHFGLLT